MSKQTQPRPKPERPYSVFTRATVEQCRADYESPAGRRMREAGAEIDRKSRTV